MLNGNMSIKQMNNNDLFNSHILNEGIVKGISHREYKEYLDLECRHNEQHIKKSPKKDSHRRSLSLIGQITHMIYKKVSI